MSLWSWKFQSVASKGENVLSQSAHLFTTSLANQNAQETIESEEKIISDQCQMQRWRHMLFC